MLWPRTCHSLSSWPPAPLQLWYFWRRRLFIWISFMDSYFEILLYVRPHPSSPILAWEGAPCSFGDQGASGTGTSMQPDPGAGLLLGPAHH